MNDQQYMIIMIAITVLYSVYVFGFVVLYLLGVCQIKPKGVGD